VDGSARRLARGVGGSEVRTVASTATLAVYVVAMVVVGVMAIEVIAGGQWRQLRGRELRKRLEGRW